MTGRRLVPVVLAAVAGFAHLAPVPAAAEDAAKKGLGDQLKGLLPGGNKKQ